MKREPASLEKNAQTPRARTPNSACQKQKCHIQCHIFAFALLAAILQECAGERGEQEVLSKVCEISLYIA